ncbi:MAG TPA: patatin-like phospholipase family protein, partial [Rhodocyclaceae bacterium]|nr:patatin-like phospholipase family protein [Rhodocyclaceae bacterium]
HPKTCLVLSGGGARGVSHIGVLRALEEQHIPVDCIAGTSMGAIVGGLYSAGYSAAELDRLVRELDWGEQFDDRPPRTERSQQQKDEDFDFPVSLELGYKDGAFSLPKGTVGGVGFERMLARLTRRVSAVNDFNRLPIPFRAVATDLVNGEGVVFDHGSLAQVMRASMSVPGAFAPIEVDGHIYADGGLVSNLPVDAAKAMGAERIIAVNIGTPLASKENLGNVLGVTRQMISILAGQNVKAQLAKLTSKDVLITPELGRISSMDFPHAIEGIDAGYAAAKAAAPALAALVLDDAQWQAHVAARPQPKGYTGKLAFVDVQGTRRSNPEALLNGISTVPGDEADDTKLQADAARLLGRGDFERVDYRLTPAPAAGADRFGATFNVVEKEWGVDMFRLGLGGSTDFEGGAGFDVLIGHRRAWMNDWGGEWRNRLQLGRTRAFSSEFVQPLSSGGSVFVAPKVEMERRTQDQFQGNQRVSQWVGGFDRVGVDLGMPVGIFGTLGEARVGVAQGRFRATQRIGSLGVPDIHFTETGLTGSLVLDQLSDAAFPREGWRVAGSFFNARHHDDFGGGRDPYTRWQGNALGAFSEGRNTWQWGLEMGGFLDKSRLGYSDFRLGGFQRLSGYRNDQIDGNFMALGKLSYRYRFAELTPFGRSLYGGGSLEMGNAWANRDQMSWGSLRRAGSFFLAADTPLGPAYVAFGVAEGGNRAVYLFLGRP